MTTKIKAGVIGDGVVGTTQIAANAVTSAKLAQNSVLTKHIDDNQIGIDQLNVSDGSSGQVLTTNGSGTLSFSTISGGVDGISTSADATAITIDSSENIGMPTVAPAGPVAPSTPKLGISGVNAQEAQIVIHRHKGNVNGPYFVLAKSQSDTNDRTIVTDGAHLGTISFQGSDGSIFQQGAQIQAQVEGTPGSADMPGRLLFLTTPDGSATPTEKLRILSGGGITFNGDTATANALDDYEEGTWTPAFYTYSGVTTTTTTTGYGIYTKIGRMVYIHAKLHVTLSSLPGQIVTITGLPFAGLNATTDAGQRAIFVIGGDAANVGSYGNGRAHFRLNNDQLQGVWMNSGSTSYWYYNSMDSTTFKMNIHGHYAT